MKQRSVVTSFLTYSEQENSFAQGDKILLLKRSDKVRTYQHRWGGVSGSIETGDNSPLERAITEIQQETNLTQSDVTLVRAGKPIICNAENYDTIWTVYPFLFRLNSKDTAKRVNINWEHDTFQWIQPEELNSFDTVPKIAEAFHRVYLPETAHNELMYMLNNRSSGARELAEKALDIIAEIIKDKSCQKFAQSPKDLYLAWLNIGWHICQVRPTMKASITFTVVNLMQQIRKKVLEGDSSIESIERTSFDIIEKMKLGFKEAEQRINQAFASALVSHKIIDSLHIMTMSYSSTIFSVLSNYISRNLSSDNPCNITITIMESRPLNEGSTFARKLSALLPNADYKNQYVKIQVITDASCDYFMPTVTHVLLGSDKILKDGSVINKMGSVPLALAAKHHGKIVLVISGTDKIGGDEDETMEEKDAIEITLCYAKEWNDVVREKGVTVRNVYFEKVEAGLIDGYVTEGKLELLTVEDIRSLWDKRKSIENIFNELSRS
ncbi:1715_t:CDS:2 [Acaulospora morrowiae]|uniref:1715_t:CDS:1 n=1 Tax=Acaulospora morrowiae TaxID=94023 RepID=A0A9N8V2Q8_9GLOM|nr:1715_t:CDS:2 [Acaulospora morrowiae]